ncbi:hypothetical protein KCU73_g66, partial [Aureobasidium melanogenum]
LACSVSRVRMAAATLGTCDVRRSQDIQMSHPCQCRAACDCGNVLCLEAFQVCVGPNWLVGNGDVDFGDVCCQQQAIAAFRCERRDGDDGTELYSRIRRREIRHMKKVTKKSTIVTRAMMTNRRRRGSILPGDDRDRDSKATAVALVWCMFGGISKEWTDTKGRCAGVAIGSAYLSPLGGGSTFKGFDCLLPQVASAGQRVHADRAEEHVFCVAFSGVQLQPLQEVEKRECRLTFGSFSANGFHMDPAPVLHILALLLCSDISCRACNRGMQIRLTRVLIALHESLSHKYVAIHTYDSWSKGC